MLPKTNDTTAPDLTTGMISEEVKEDNKGRRVLLFKSDKFLDTLCAYPDFNGFYRLKWITNKSELEGRYTGEVEARKAAINYITVTPGNKLLKVIKRADERDARRISEKASS